MHEQSALSSWLLAGRFLLWFELDLSQVGCDEGVDYVADEEDVVVLQWQMVRAFQDYRLPV
jgi:hypothetical protein